jgi:PTH1 family peptidyl-tRNA hydrolase
MLIIAGLGNPERKYLFNRHNVGFMVVDAIAHAVNAGPWRKKFSSLCADFMIPTEQGPKKGVLLKPQTYYNESGRAIGEAAHFYKVGPEAVTVFHDELDLAPGKFRLKTGGGAAGNNGIKSTTSVLGPDFRRGRIGVGHPGDRNRVTGYVLSDFSKAEQAWLGELLDAIGRSFSLLAAGEADAFQTRVTHLAPAPKEAGPGGGPAQD